MAILVYKLTCTVSGKSYVGITGRALDTRWLEHCQRAREGLRNSRLYDAMRKYGLDAFSREVIATADSEDEARSLECAYIKELGTYEGGYNANEGGCGWLKVPDDVCRKIGEAQKGKIITDECRAKMSSAKLGDKRMATHLGDNTKTGSHNPRAHAAVIRFPDGSENHVVGLRAFALERGLNYTHLKDRGRTKGFFVVRKLGMSISPGADNALNTKEN